MTPQMAHHPEGTPPEPLASLLLAIGVCAQSPNRYPTCEELLTSLHVIARTPSDWRWARPVLEAAQVKYQSQMNRRHLKTLSAITRAHATALTYCGDANEVPVPVQTATRVMPDPIASSGTKQAAQHP
jgi:hypothetical protein